MDLQSPETMPNEKDESGDPIPFLVYDKCYGWIVAYREGQDLKPHSNTCGFLTAANGSDVILEHIKCWARLPNPELPKCSYCGGRHWQHNCPESYFR